MATRTIHVVKPTGAKFQFDFADPDPMTGRRVDLSDAGVLRVLAGQRRLFGTVGDKPVRDPVTAKAVPHEDRRTGDWGDSPDLAVGEIGPDGAEVKRLRGPQPEVNRDPATNVPGVPGGGGSGRGAES
jgi:hypothetical protein